MALLEQEAWRFSPLGVGTTLDEAYQRAAHLKLIQRHAVRAISRGRGRLIITCPPRHGKSELLSHWLPVWMFSLNPRASVIVSSYASELATDFGRKTRNTIEAHGDRLGVYVRQDSHAAFRWETTAGGTMHTVGVDKGIIGRGGDLVVVDDPHKDWKEAQSALKRKDVWDWWTGTLRHRIHPGGTVIVIQTRWHQADFAGTLLSKAETGEGDTWDVLHLPALAIEGEVDLLGRQPGEPLWDEWFDTVAELTPGQKEILLAEGTPRSRTLEELRLIRLDMQGHKFNGVFQGVPLPGEGGMFQRDWFGRVPEAPAACKWARGWDRGATTSGDFTVGCLVGYHDGVYYLADVVRKQTTPEEAERLIRATAEADAERFGSRGKCEQWIPQGPGDSGADVAAHYKRRVLDGFSCKSWKETGSKEDRASIWSAAAEAGNFYFVVPPGADAAWVAEYLDELEEFPVSGEHDDQVDATSMGVHALSAKRKGRLIA